MTLPPPPPSPQFTLSHEDPIKKDVIIAKQREMEMQREQDAEDFKLLHLPHKQIPPFQTGGKIPLHFENEEIVDEITDKFKGASKPEGASKKKVIFSVEESKDDINMQLVSLEKQIQQLHKTLESHMEKSNNTLSLLYSLIAKQISPSHPIQISILEEDKEKDE